MNNGDARKFAKLPINHPEHEAMIDPRREAALKRKLDKLAALSREIAAEAKELYGPDAWVFAEAESGLFIMDGDAHGIGSARDTGAAARQEHIRISSSKNHGLGVGAW